MEHELKTWPIFFQQTKQGRKTFEIRKNDRDYHAGDTLLLREWCPSKQEYTGDTLLRGVRYMMEGMGIEPGYVAMAVVPITHGWDLIA